MYYQILMSLTFSIQEIGLKMVAGQTVGTDTIQCANSNAYCYNMTASAAALIDIVKAGCSLWRCMLARDRCVSTVFQKIPISLCCCSTDRCNLGDNKGLRYERNLHHQRFPDHV
ncbi:unnamed protein product [Angiostrongylus costaricensis]|uniref:Activin_recp domain-containing protein n=1 Tax=Angiostrongylus costaricensis TaxID=334426 RepID=A0A0R3PPW9_ANGCS|nr:unnamed protein product [Angiostrongylus costaricensis]